jgi:hypothetical protein
MHFVVVYQRVADLCDCDFMQINFKQCHLFLHFTALIHCVADLPALEYVTDISLRDCAAVSDAGAKVCILIYLSIPHLLTLCLKVDCSNKAIVCG